MNARLIKETRALLPMFAGTLPLIVLPQLIWPPAGFGYFALGVACVVMAGSTFGTEFQHRTISLLLSQPIPRSVIWRDKMLVLGTGMVACLAVLVGCLAVSPSGNDYHEWLVLVFIPLCAFCGAPFWTLLLRHNIAGMVAAVGAPSGMLAVYALVTEQLGGNTPEALSAAFISLLLIYCAVVYWQGYTKFQRLEALDTPAQELRLPASLEAIFVAPLTKISSRFRGPFATLLKKEFRLQQISFLLAGLFVLIAVAGFCLVKRYPEVATGIVGGDIVTYVLILPLIAGAISVAEEKGWGIAEWHLTLPPSALKQWSAKMLAALSTSLVLGLLLPTALFLAGLALLGQLGARTSLPPAFAILCWVLGQLLLTSVAVYAASFSNSTLRAILTAFAIIVASFGVFFLVGTGVAKIEPLRFWIYMHAPEVTKALIPPLLAGGLFLMLCVVQWFAWSNFRRYGLSARRIVVQLPVMFFAVGLIALAISVAIVAALFRH
jgi:ABC-type transport system involved in multi-copper enzyme maturation permease subunit